MVSAPTTVLLVDDDPTARFLTRRLLTQLAPAAHVLEAADGAQGLDLVAAHCQAAPDAGALLVLLDLHMPTLDGLEFLVRHQQHPAACRQATTVVVVSAAASPAEQVRAQTLAAAVHVKPLSTAQLTAVLRQYVPAALAAGA